MKTKYKIYLITNLISNMQYVGFTAQTIKKRFNQHCKEDSGCEYLARAIQKYGKQNFKLEQIFSFLTDDSNIHGEIEDFFITYYNTLAPNGYNLKHGGMTGKMSQEVKEKMSASQTNRNKNATKEEKFYKVRGCKEYIQSKKTSVVGVNITDSSFLRFDSQLEAEKQKYFVSNCLSKKVNVSKNYCWFYDEGQEDNYFINKTLEIIGSFGTYSKGKNSWNKCNKEERIKNIKISQQEKCKPIIGINRFDLSIKEYPSINAYIEDGYSWGSLRPVLQGKAKHAHNYCWFYKEEGKSLEYYIEKAKIQLGSKYDKTNMRSVYAVNVENTREHIYFPNLYKAEEKGHRISSIRRCLRGERQSYNGFYWALGH